MMSLNHILRKCTGGYKIHKLQEKFNHFMYMDDIKLFAKNEKELETLIQAVTIYSQTIGMEFDIEKCAMLIMKSGKRQMTDGIEVLNQEKSDRSEKKKPTTTCGRAEIKENIKKEYLNKTRKLLENTLDRRIITKGINTWAVLLVRYSGPF